MTTTDLRRRRTRAGIHRCAGCALLVTLLLLAACGQDTPSPEAADTPLSEPAGEVLARVGERAITSAQVDAFVRQRTQREPSAELREWALEELIDLNLLAAEAEAAGLIDERLEAEMQVQRLSLLANRAAAEFARGEPVAEADLNAEYERQVAVTGRQEFRLQHILVADRPAAEEALARLAAGEEFEAVMAAHAARVGAANAGDLGWVNLAQVPASFTAPVRALTPGRHTLTPIQSEYGWHVVRLVEVREFEPPAFDAVKEGIRSTLSRQRMEQHVAALRARAGIPPR